MLKAENRERRQKFSKGRILPYIEEKIWKCDTKFVAFWLRTVEDVPYPAIARILEVKVNHAYVLVHRATRELQREFGDEHGSVSGD